MIQEITEMLRNQAYYARMNLIKRLPQKKYTVMAYILMEFFGFQQ